MDALQQGILTLLRCGLSGLPEILPVGFDLEQVYPLLKRHQIIPLVYQGAVNCGLEKSSPAMQRLFQSYCQCLIQNEVQITALKEVFLAFDTAGIHYMPLKGICLKELYPKPEMRLMGDADVLIRQEQYEQICAILPKLGFDQGKESDHELVWHKKALHLELHKRLIPSYNKNYHSYFGDGWRLATQKTGVRYRMREEDEFIYLFTHFAKHYRDGGIGLRHVLDLWVYRQAYPQLDEGYLTTELSKLRLLEFYRNICGLLDVWMNGGVPDEKNAFIQDFIFDSGSWGNEETRALATGAKAVSVADTTAQAWREQLCYNLFPSLERMQYRYPVLKKAPALLPVLWPVRWATAVLFRRKNIKERGEIMALIRSKKTATYQESLHYVGLDFDFEE